MKKIFGVPLSDGEEICEDTLHELGCGCPECTGHDSEGANMVDNVPQNCVECDYAKTCTNPGPYGSYRCAYRSQIEAATLFAALNPPKKEVNPNGNR